MKTIKIYMISCLITIVCTATTCDNSADFADVYLENKSEEAIWVRDYGYYNDTTLLDPYKLFKLQEPLDEVIPNAIHKFNKCISFEELEQGVKLQIIIFKQSTLDKYTTEELIENDIFDKRYVLTYDKLEAMGFKIVYTGE